ARIRTWTADSSADTYRVRRPDRAHLAAASSSSVDLPTPGSPASRSTPPGTTPPPSTRSNSAMPDAERSVDSAFTSVIGRAPTAGVAGAVRAVWVIPASSTVPHAWHWPQRPTHFPVVQPHSLQRKTVLGLPAIRSGYRRGA